VDQTKFQEAQNAYDSGDLRAATKLFLASADRGVAGNGAAYHMAGNALMRLRRFPDAATVYGHALRDDTYERRGALFVNLGQARCAMGEYAQASESFESALAEPGYATPHKAWRGLADSLMERGKVEEAASAYRKAAIDPGNPDPGKALVNLGLCFMGLGRPADAAEAYRAALGVERYQGRGKALSNLGMAYVANGEYQEAVRAFEKATQLHAYVLPAAAQQAYDTALTQVSPVKETIDGWETGEIADVEGIRAAADGWATGELAGLNDPTGFASDPPACVPDADAAARDLGFGDAEAVTTFFARTETEMRDKDREERRVRRVAERTSAWYARRVGAAVLATVLVLGLLGGAFWLGYGWPMQSNTVVGLLDAYKRGEETARYWVAVPGKDIDKEMAKVPPIKEFQLSGVDQGPWRSSVRVTITPEKGAPLHYKVTLAREGVGWKITGIDNDWRSTDG
jgi:tetratricopeptide (TPR) repeat protein